MFLWLKLTTVFTRGACVEFRPKQEYANNKCISGFSAAFLQNSSPGGWHFQYLANYLPVLRICADKWSNLQIFKLVKVFCLPLALLCPLT